MFSSIYYSLYIEIFPHYLHWSILLENVLVLFDFQGIKNISSTTLRWLDSKNQYFERSDNNIFSIKIEPIKMTKNL